MIDMIIIRKYVYRCCFKKDEMINYGYIYTIFNKNDNFFLGPRNHNTTNEYVRNYKQKAFETGIQDMLSKNYQD